MKGHPGPADDWHGSPAAVSFGPPFRCGLRLILDQPTDRDGGPTWGIPNKCDSINYPSLPKVALNFPITIPPISCLSGYSDSQIGTHFWQHVIGYDLSWVQLGSKLGSHYRVLWQYTSHLLPPTMPVLPKDWIGLAPKCQSSGPATCFVKATFTRWQATVLV